MRKRPRTPIREKVADAIEIPKELALCMPKITLLAQKEVTVENYKGIITLSAEEIRIYTAAGILCLSGSEMDIASITDEDIHISGIVQKIEFE